MKITLKIKLALSILTVLGLVSCRENEVVEPEPVIVEEPVIDEKPVTVGVYVLNEGGYGAANTSLSYYEFKSATAIPNIFSNSNNGAYLGDTGQDIIVYGSKSYIVVHGSNKVNVINTKSAKLIKSIALTATTEAPAFPRYAASSKGKVFVSAYDDKVYVIDTLDLAIKKSIPVGKDPEQLAVVGEKLYVANSGGLSATFDNTISVIDVNSLTETKKIEVDINLGSLKADKYGDLYVISQEVSYGTSLSASKLYVIDTKTDAVKKKFDINASDLAIHGDLAYVYGFSYLSFSANYTLIDVNTETIKSEKFITDGSESAIQLPYGIAVDPISGDVYIGDAKDYTKNGEVFCYDVNGKKKFSFQAGVSPSAFAFYTK